MKRTTTVATHHLEPTVHIDAVPDLARERELFKERERAQETNEDEVVRESDRTAA